MSTKVNSSWQRSKLAERATQTSFRAATRHSLTCLTIHSTLRIHPDRLTLYLHTVSQTEATYNPELPTHTLPTPVSATSTASTMSFQDNPALECTHAASPLIVHQRSH
jgi:hypothetical protein